MEERKYFANEQTFLNSQRVFSLTLISFETKKYNNIKDDEKNFFFS